jgi:CBS domain-containing protein
MNLEVEMRRHTVAEVMTTDVVTVREETGYKEIVETMAVLGISAVPVVDDDARVIGVVSEADLLLKVEYAGLQPELSVLRRRRVRTAMMKANGDMAGDIMTAPATVVSPDETIAVAAKRMDTEKVKRLPVVDRDGRLVGIVSRSDLLRPFLRADDDIRQEIQDEVLLATMWLDPRDFTVTVDQGIVTVHGTVERKSIGPVLVGLVRSVAGVVDVVDRLTFRYDDTTHHVDGPTAYVA